MIVTNNSQSKSWFSNSIRTQEKHGYPTPWPTSTLTTPELALQNKISKSPKDTKKSRKRKKKRIYYELFFAWPQKQFFFCFFLFFSSLCLVLNHSFTSEEYTSLIKVCFSYLFQGCFFFFLVGCLFVFTYTIFLFLYFYSYVSQVLVPRSQSNKYPLNVNLIDLLTNKFLIKVNKIKQNSSKIRYLYGCTFLLFLLHPLTAMFCRIESCTVFLFYY